MLARLIVFLMNHLSVKGRTIVVNAVINRAGLPIRSIITTDGSHRILIQGKPVSVEQAASLRAGAIALRSNPTLKVIRDQVRFLAIDRGFLQTDEPIQQLSYKMALWYAQEETQLIDMLAGAQDSTL